MNIVIYVPETKELEIQKRIIFENDGFNILVPFWAIYPFETMIVPKRHLTNILDIFEVETLQYGEANAALTIAYDKIYNTSFPYCIGIHQSPTDGRENKD